jgi:phosphoribosylamine--glycine ligase
VYCLTALVNTIGEAQVKALKLCQKVTFDSAQYRKNIGYRAIARENA